MTKSERRQQGKKMRNHGARASGIRENVNNRGAGMLHSPPPNHKKMFSINLERVIRTFREQPPIIITRLLRVYHHRVCIHPVAIYITKVLTLLREILYS